MNPPTVNVAVVFAGLAFTDEAIDPIMRAMPDAVVSQLGSVLVISSPIQAGDEESAAFVLIDQVTDAAPSARAIRVDQDLVSISDIAERTGRSRESIRLLVEGRRGPGGFPAPIGVVGDRMRIWPWAVVFQWFTALLGDDLGEHGIAPETAAAVDAVLASRSRPSGTAGGRTRLQH